jgi:hypothetical protein
MLPPINSKNVYIEITNPEHGGDGWELGNCLWSPTENRSGQATWRLMNKIRRGDIIIHLVLLNNLYHWYGISLAESELMTTNNTPPIPSKWEGFEFYQRVNLSNFIPLPRPYPTDEFFSAYYRQLTMIRKDEEEGQFYVVYGKNEQIRMAQRYVAKCPASLYALFDDFSSGISFNPVFHTDEYEPTIHEPQNPDFFPPGRVETKVSRIIRDTELARQIKAEFKWRCQICGSSIQLTNDCYYAEAHHIQPLGSDYQGPDIRSNIIIVCPNHHTEFDYGVIAIDPNSGFIIHLDVNNLYHNSHPAYQRPDIAIEFLRFHYTKRFRG